jgi:hypothetical protein
MNPNVGSLRLVAVSIKAIKDLQLMAVNGKESEYINLPYQPDPKPNEPKKL